MENTPKKEFHKQAREIDYNIKSIVDKWEKLQMEYKEQLKNKPDSWAGIGRGADLEGLIETLKELNNRI